MKRGIYLIAIFLLIATIPCAAANSISMPWEDRYIEVDNTITNLNSFPDYIFVRYEYVVNDNCFYIINKDTFKSDTSAIYAIARDELSKPDHYVTMVGNLNGVEYTTQAKLTGVAIKDNELCADEAACDEKGTCWNVADESYQHLTLSALNAKEVITNLSITEDVGRLSTIKSITKYYSIDLGAVKDKPDKIELTRDELYYLQIIGSPVALLILLALILSRRKSG